MDRPLVAGAPLAGGNDKALLAGGDGVSGQRCWKCALRKGLSNGQGQGGKGERHNQTSGDSLRAVRIDLEGSSHSGALLFLQPSRARTAFRVGEYLKK
jgi:hypothetical protein